ncbi:MAG: DegT/DnrJ/EryC1/StrS family aminotransferase [Candidatus Brocadiia bacterium]
MPVPYLDLKTQHRAMMDEILTDVKTILSDAWFVGGPFIEGFEAEFARRCGTKFAVAVNSGTAACRYAYYACDFEPGDEIITVPNTFFATCEAAHMWCGGVRFIDIDPETYNMDPAGIESAINDDTRLIVPVHLYGLPCDMDPILEIANRREIAVVEDACQSHFASYKGRPVGSMGMASTFSFYPSKNLGACGDAGAVVTSDPEIADGLRMMRDHGQKGRYNHIMVGDNGRMSAIQASILIRKMQRIDGWTEARIRVASSYKERLADIGGLKWQKVPDDRNHVYYMFVITHPEREKIAEEFDRCGIGYGFRGVKPLHLQELYADIYAPGDFPHAERFAATMLALPIFPEMTEQQIEEVCGAVKRAVG